MSWQDRRYDDDGGRYAPRSDRPVATLWIVGITIGISALIWLFGGGVFGEGTNQVNEAFWLDTDRPLEVWRWLTSAFLHGGPGHVLMNMLMVFFIGRFIESAFGSRQFLYIYLGLAVFASFGLFAEAIITGGPLRSLGASGAAMGLVALLGSRFPMMQILFFGTLQMRCWVLAAVMVGIDILSVLAYQGADRTAHSVHLAGALGGFLYGYGWPRFEVYLEASKVQRERSRREATQQKTVDEKYELDRVLEKIKDEGMDALSSREREFLLAQSEKLKGGRK
ncbi:MAG: rhomboid family intramembrane serine protease [Planctomycetota bacterium]